MIYLVKFTKYFVSGNLKDLTYKSQLGFTSLSQAEDYLKFLEDHNETPVQTLFGSSNYTCHMAKIETFESKPKTDDLDLFKKFDQQTRES